MEDVFNNGFWKLCITVTNDLEPAGLNLLEQFHTHMLFDGLLMISSVLITISVSVKFQFVKLRKLSDLCSKIYEKKRLVGKMYDLFSVII